MFKKIFVLSKVRTLKEAVVFYLVYLGLGIALAINMSGFIDDQNLLFWGEQSKRNHNCSVSWIKGCIYKVTNLFI